MKASIVTGTALVIFGISVMIYGRFNYASKIKAAIPNTVEFTVKDKNKAYTTIWLGVIAFTSGGVVLFIKKKKPK